MWKLNVPIQFCFTHPPFGAALNHALQRVNAHRRGGEDDKICTRIPELCEGLAKNSEFAPLLGSTVVEVGTEWTSRPTTWLRVAGSKGIITFDHVRHPRLYLAKLASQVAKDDADTISQRLGVRGRNCNAL